MSPPAVEIRPYQPADAAAVYQAIRESLPELSQWLPDMNASTSLDTVQAYIARREDQANRRLAYDFAIVDREDQGILGGCGLNQINWQHGYANLYYWVRTSQAGQGIAGEAARQLARYGIRTLGLQRIEILVAVENHASLRVVAKLGAAREGLLRNRIYVRGMWHDAYVHSLLAADFTEP